MSLRIWFGKAWAHTNKTLKNKFSSKLLLQTEQAQFCFNMFFQFQNKAERLSRLEKLKKQKEL